MQNIRGWLLVLPLAWLLTACVTINIYFPAAAAEKAAEQIVDEVLGQPAAQSPKQEGSKPDQSSFIKAKASTFAMGVIDFFIAPAHAEADINISTPKVRALRSSMASRADALKPYYQQGNIGFTNDGFITLRSTAGLSARDKLMVRKLTKEENAERRQLYAAIAKANGHPEWENDIRQTFAKTWIQKIPSGWWYQKSGGQWSQK